MNNTGKVITKIRLLTESSTVRCISVSMPVYWLESCISILCFPFLAEIFTVNTELIFQFAETTNSSMPGSVEGGVSCTFSEKASLPSQSWVHKTHFDFITQLFPTLWWVLPAMAAFSARYFPFPNAVRLFSSLNFLHWRKFFLFLLPEESELNWCWVQLPDLVSWVFLLLFIIIIIYYLWWWWWWCC